jgi:7-cyano-7-deazaguanine synthase
METNKKAVILLSGGLDSTTILAIAKSQRFALHTLTFKYGQRHDNEIQAAQKIADYFHVQNHIVLNIDMRTIGGSALTDDIEVPKDRGFEEMNTGIPITYVPARNTIFLSFALAYAETLRANDIFIGINAVDYSGYPDCRPEYIGAFEKMANLATKTSVENGQRIKIHTPLIKMTKGEIIKTGLLLNVDYSLTTTCYDPDPQGFACGLCDACLLRLKGFEEAGIPDPLSYKKVVI